MGARGRSLACTTAQGRPNLFVVGAMKSGTTTIAAYLDRHPAITVSNPKEPSYFVEPSVLATHWRSMWERRYWADERAYLDLFHVNEATRYLCDASTLYAKLPDIDGVAEKIRDYAPHARIIYVMRDPVMRAISHYWHAFRAGEETRSMAAAIFGDDSAYLAYGRYPMQLAPYLAAFGRQRIYLMVAERVNAAPLDEMNQLFTWLDLHPLPARDLPAIHHHATPEVAENPTLQSPLYRALRADRLDPIKRRLPTSVKVAVKTLLGGATRRAPNEPATLHRHLDQYYAPDRLRVEALLGGAVPEWRSKGDRAVHEPR